MSHAVPFAVQRNGCSIYTMVRRAAQDGKRRVRMTAGTFHIVSDRVAAARAADENDFVFSGGKQRARHKRGQLGCLINGAAAVFLRF